MIIWLPRVLHDGVRWLRERGFDYTFDRLLIHVRLNNSEEEKHMNHSNPKVSVIIPVYNAENYLRECLDSVINQTLKETEIICVDDGSEDSSLVILEEYKERDKRIKVLSQGNQGSGPARNKGMLSAEGEYISFMDSDDFYPVPETLEKLYKKAVERSALICGGSLCVCYASGEHSLHYDPKHLWGHRFEAEGWVEYRDYQYDYFYYRFLYNREMLVQNDIFFPPLRRFQDPPFFVQAMLQAGRFYAIPDVTYCHRENDKTAIIQASKEKTRDLLMGHAMILDLARKNNLRKLFELTVERCVEGYNKEFNSAAAMNDDEINTILSKLNITASEVMDGRPNAFFQMQTKNRHLEEKVRILQYDLDCVHASTSYHIGRTITWLPRKIRGGVRCYREHGLRYAAQRFVDHITGRS